MKKICLLFLSFALLLPMISCEHEVVPDTSDTSDTSKNTLTESEMEYLTDYYTSYDALFPDLTRKIDFDIDGDGEKETITNVPGPTSGLWTEVFTVFKDGMIIFRNTFNLVVVKSISPTDNRTPDGFYVVSGKLYHCGFLVECDGKKLVLKDENGNIQPYWGDGRWNLDIGSELICLDTARYKSPDNFTAEQYLEMCKRGGYLVFEDGKLAAGAELLDLFLNGIKNRDFLQSTLYIVHFYSEGTADMDSLNPVLFFVDLTYDAQDGYKIADRACYEDTLESDKSYKYLYAIDTETHPMNPNNPHAGYDYFLANEDDLTVEKYYRSLFSSDFREIIDTRLVATDCPKTDWIKMAD